MFRLAPLLLFLSVMLSGRNLNGLTISEIMYNSGEQGFSQDLFEYIELYNENPDPLDLSGFYLQTEEMDFSFEAGTWLEGYSALLVCRDSEAIRTRYSITNVVGPWNGHLADDFDDPDFIVTFRDRGGRIVSTVNLTYSGKWPAGADGTGHSIELRDPFSDPADPDSWMLSSDPGGSPGHANPCWPAGLPVPPEGECRQRVPVVINEALLATARSRWVELYNKSHEPVDLSAYYLTTTASDLTKFQFPAGTSIGANSWLLFTDAELGDMSDFVALVEPDGARVVDACYFVSASGEKSEARIPDGGSSFSPAAEPTPGAANVESVSTAVVINELMYHPIHGGAEREYIELYNRGDASVDLSGWELHGGDEDDFLYRFPRDARIAAGGYLVVASDPDFVSTIYRLHSGEVFGPFIAPPGGLSDRGGRLTLEDGLGRVVDSLHYHPGGEWPRWAGGYGSSMELVDPMQDNSLGPAWDASDDSGKAESQIFSYMAHHGIGEAGFNLLLLDRGIAVVDDISIIAVGGDETEERVENGHFEANASGWVIEGTHVRSGVIAQDAISGTGSLRVIASAPGDDTVNHIHTPAPDGSGLLELPADQDFRISFKARWAVGSQTLLTHGNGHSMARAHELLVPLNLGTPGRVNSVTERLVEREGSANLGPVITDVSQDPALPEAQESVTITARVLDSDGVASARLEYYTDSVSGVLETSTMTHEGGGIYRGEIPGQSLGTTVLFSVSAIDLEGRSGRYPADVTTRTHPLLVDIARATPEDQHYCIYRHDTRSGVIAFHDYRFYMTEVDELRLDNRKRMSQELVEGSLVFGARRIYYGAQLRFEGSPGDREGWSGDFRVVMPTDDLLHGRIEEFNVESHGGDPMDARERVAQYLQSHNGSHTRAAVSDLPSFTLLRWRVNDRVQADRERVPVPDRSFFFQGEYPNEEDCSFLDMGSHLASPGVLYPPPSPWNDADGDKKENYRSSFSLRANEGADDYSQFIEFARFMDPIATQDAFFDEQIRGRCNVEQFVRTWTLNLNIDAWETWGAHSGRNTMFYQPGRGETWQVCTWDLEKTFSNAESFLPPSDPSLPFEPGAFVEVNRMLNRPEIKRMVYAVLEEMVNDFSPSDPWFHSSHLSAYMSKLAALGMTHTDIGQPGGFIDQRASLIRERIRDAIYPQVRLRITTNSGEDFETEEFTVDLSGTAPADADDFVIMRNNGEMIGESVYPTRFSSMTDWIMRDIPLEPGRNELSVIGFGLRGDLIDHDSITVTVTSGPFDPPEIMSLNPSEARVGEDIEIVGRNFLDGIRVFFDSVESTHVVYEQNGPTPGTIVARVPALEWSGQVLVFVRNFDGQESNLVPFTCLPPPPRFLRGDSNADGGVDMSDAIATLGFLFLGSGAPPCIKASDANDDSRLDISDAVNLLSYLFLGGPAPELPFPNCGVDPTLDALTCESFIACEEP